MKITLHNIGKIGEASIELHGITVIAGENDTGKSTVGKALYSVFNSLYKITEQIDKERRNSIEQIMSFFAPAILLNMDENRDGFGTKKLIENSKKNLQNPELLQKEIEGFFLKLENFFGEEANGDKRKEYIKSITEILHVSDDEIFKAIVLKKLNLEFDRQITNIYFPEKEGQVELAIKDIEVAISVLDSNMTGVSNKLRLHTEVLYIDDPFILDKAKLFPSLQDFFEHNDYNSNHREHLLFKLFSPKIESNVIAEIIATKKLDTIFSKINTVCSGEIVETSPNAFGYKKNGGKAILDIKNLSTGLKTFIILKTLLLNGALKKNGTIVLDEPEIHLHPKWQLLFAELIVLIQKEFGLHILINTHSPYFLRAIEVYSAEYEIADTCKYYLAEIKDDIATFEDVTINTDKIYKKLAEPLETLQSDRYSGD